MTVFLLYLAGCGSGKNAPERETIRNGRAYVIESTIVVDIESGMQVRDLKLSCDGKIVYYAVTDDGGNTCIRKIGIDDNGIAKEETCISEKGYYLSYSLSSEGPDLLLTAGDDIFFLHTYEAGKRTISISLDSAYFNDSYPFFVSRLNESEYLIMSRKAACVCDGNGSVVKSYQCPGEGFISAVKSGDMNYFVSYSKDTGINAISVFDARTGQFIDELTVDYNPLFLCGESEACLISDGDLVELYSKNDKDIIPIYKLSRKSISRDSMKGFVSTESGLAILSHDVELNPNIIKVTYLQETDQEVPLYSEEYDEDGRRIIYVYSHQSANYSRGLLGEPADAFMFENTQYCIRFMDVDSAIDFVIDENYKPDIICELTPYQITQYAEKGYLTDLWSFIEKSEKLSKEDINDVIPDCYEIEGKLFGITDAFSVMGLMVSDAPEEYGETWTVDEFLRWIEDNPGVRSLRGINKSDIFSFCIMGNLEEYIDLEDMKSEFDSEAYMLLLERISDLKLNGDSGTPLTYSDDMTEELGGNAYLAVGTIGSVNQIAKEEVRIGKKLKYIGYPSDNETTRGILFPIYNLAITNKSECKEGAYAFIEYCLLRYGDKIKAARADNRIRFAGEFCTINDFLKQNMDLAKGKDFLGFMYEDGYHEFEVTEEHLEAAQSVIESARADTYLEREIRSIAIEEFEAFLAGYSDADRTAKTTQNRVQLLLDESR